MRHSKKPRRGRGRVARDASDAPFERALLGDGFSDDKTFDPRRDRKTLQLCRQVQRALSLALAGDVADEALLQAYVESVEPMGGPGQLLVRVTLPPGTAGSPAAVSERLAAHAPRLRAVVATEICRKRVPMLSFVVVPSALPDAHEGGTGDE